VESVPTLIVVPVRVERDEDIEPFLQTVASLRGSAPEAMVLVVDDRSPAPYAQMLELASDELDCAYVLQQDGEGVSAAINVGLTAAKDHGMDACLVAPGLTFNSTGWLGRLRARTGLGGAPAAIAGGAVIDPTGLIRQAGYFFSAFRRHWSARLGRVPEVMLDTHAALLCPVSSELQFVRKEWIEQVGVYDELLSGPHAALDYCLRVAQAGGECIFEPTVRARGLALEEGEPDNDAPDANRLRVKHAGVSFQQWAPEVV
jgi:GT2 family glycosyltransferase